MESKHTPGPWTCEHMRTSIHKGEQTLARIYYGEGRTASESEANAKLIAAAPELLDTMRLLLDVLEAEKTERERESGVEEYDPTTHPVWKRARYLVDLHA